jgi:hypothetical protein
VAAPSDDFRTALEGDQAGTWTIRLALTTAIVVTVSMALLLARRGDQVLLPQHVAEGIEVQQAEAQGQLRTVSAETARIIKRMLQVNPADRYQSYDELMGQLAAAQVAVGRSKSRLGGKSGFFQKLFAPIAGAVFGDEKNAP